RSKHHKEIVNVNLLNKNKEYLETLINAIKVNKHIPVVVVTPFHYEYNKHFSDKWLNENFYNQIHEVTEKLDVTFLDYSKDKKFQHKDQLFEDQDHLNMRGRYVFTKTFFSDLEKEKNINHTFFDIRKFVKIYNEKLSKDLVLKSSR